MLIIRRIRGKGRITNIQFVWERERFYSLYQTRRVSRAEPNKNLTKK